MHLICSVLTSGICVGSCMHGIGVHVYDKWCCVHFYEKRNTKKWCIFTFSPSVQFITKARHGESDCGAAVSCPSQHAILYNLNKSRPHSVARLSWTRVHRLSDVMGCTNTGWLPTSRPNDIVGGRGSRCSAPSILIGRGTCPAPSVWVGRGTEETQDVTSRLPLQKICLFSVDAPLPRW